MKKTITYFTVLAASIVFVNVASANCPMSGKDCKHDHADGAKCAMKSGEDKKACPKDCAKPCCSKAKTNFGPKKRY